MLKDFNKVFSALGEPTRLKIIKLLETQKLCVCELSAVLDMLQPRISQHLRVLKEADLVTEEKDGSWSYYAVNKEKLSVLFENFTNFLEQDLAIMPDFKNESKNMTNLACNPKVKATKSLIKNGQEA